MLPEKVKNANIGVGVGFVLEIAGRVMMSAHVGPVLIGAAVTLVGVVAFVWGCFNYSEGKGHSPFLGLLGLLSCLGLIVLLLLPDKYKNGAPPPGSGGTYSSQPGVWPPPPNSPS